MVTWSYSKLADYEKCPAVYKYRHVDKLPEPKATALERGIKVHTTIEDYIAGAGALPPDYKRFSAYIDHVKLRPGLVVEEMWALDRNWQRCDPRASPAWWRGKLDAYWREGTTAHVVDWKTGKIYDSNRDQMRLYAGAVMSREAQVEHVVVELVYLDARESRAEDYTRDEHYVSIRDDFTRRVARLEAEQTFAPRPNKFCKWCAFARSKGGPCSVG